MTREEVIFYLDRRDRGYAKLLFVAMHIEAQRDPSYRAKFEKWLAEGGTLLLRDELARRFEFAAFVQHCGQRFKYPWHEMWTALDTTSLNLHVAEELLRKYPAIVKTCLHISYANGGVNRTRPETQVKFLLGLLLEEKRDAWRLREINDWLATKTDAEIEILTDGEEDEAKAVLVGAPDQTNELLEVYFASIC